MYTFKPSSTKRRVMKRLSSITEPILADATKNQGAIYTQICSLWLDIANDMQMELSKKFIFHQINSP